ncbi:MAG: hypothetical protein M3Y54_04345, partial [Bacteroidota bacterium]|nr:hypothetical protein [Bacteroidota bacterium]
MVAGASAQAQSTLATATVAVRAEAQASPPLIRFTWKLDAQATYYDVYRWSKGASLATAVQLFQSTTGTATLGEFVDSTAVVGRGYEYRIRKDGPNGSGEGLVLAGIEVAATEHRGTVVLVVDATHAAYLAPDLARLQADLVGDGWTVIRHDVAPTDTPPQVKALIMGDYLARPNEVRTVFLLGHVAVPYSGDINPDAHPDHLGAWPADSYYADMAGIWTDTQVSNAIASRPENRNLPGDGKFDQSMLPRTIQLEVGRVDLSNLPAFALPERELLRRYLLKDHQFRHRQFAVAERGLVDDQFGLSTGEPFANNGWRNFTPLFGIGVGGVEALPYFSTLRTADYLWAYACGPGSYTTEGGVGNTADFASGPVKSVFNMHFGSYFGDWDNADNYLRAALAADGYTLTNCWAGRPDWFFHFMGLGETVGYCTRRSQPINDINHATGGGEVHTALLGDPTLHLHVLAPPTNLTATIAGSTAALAWAASPEPVAGYYVYRAPTAAGPFFRISAQPVAATNFADPLPRLGTSYYMVRALQLKDGASGSYYNLSQGASSNFIAPAPPVSGGTWLGTSSPDWHTPANWSTGVVPTSTGTATVPAGTPFAPLIAGSELVAWLTLGPQARLTVAAGASLGVKYAVQVQGAAPGNPATSLVLAPATAALPGGRLAVLDYTSAERGLILGAGTALQVGAQAEMRLLGSFDAGSATVTFDPLGRLVFDHDSTVFGPSYQHGLAGAATLAVGVLRVGDSRETLVLTTPVEISSQVENLGTIQTNNRLVLRSGPGRQALLAPVVPVAGQPRSLGRYSGTLSVQVYVDSSRNAGLGYRHLTVPVSGPTVRSLTTSAFVPVVNPLYNTVGSTVIPLPTVFAYSQARVGSSNYPGPLGFEQGWASPSSLSSRLGTAQGLAVNVSGNTTFSFSGTPLTTALSLDRLDRDSIADGGWYFLGNPYAAPLNWNSLTADSSRFSGLNTALYVFKSSGRYSGTFASYLPGARGAPGLGVNGGGPVLPIGQAFFVRADSIYHSGSLTFSLDDLLANPAAPNVQRGSDTRPRLLLTLRDAAGTQAHQTLVYFQVGATAGVDTRYDAPYLAGPGQALSLASADSLTAFSINGLPPLTGADVLVPL